MAPVDLLRPAVLVGCRLQVVEAPVQHAEVDPDVGLLQIAPDVAVPVPFRGPREQVERMLVAPLGLVQRTDARGDERQVRLRRRRLGLVPLGLERHGHPLEELAGHLEQAAVERGEPRLVQHRRGVTLQTGGSQAGGLVPQAADPVLPRAHGHDRR